MSFTLVASEAVNDALLDGGLAHLINDGVDPAYAILYESTTALVTMLFASPAVTLVNHELVFAQGNVGGDFITSQGDADRFELHTATGLLIGYGDVTDAAGSGTLKISGTTGTRLYAGARAILDELKLSLTLT